MQTYYYFSHLVIGCDYMDKLIYLIDTLFEHSGSGVPDTNITYYNYIKRTINVEKIDILGIAKKTYNLNNETVLRNLALLKIGKQLKGKDRHVLHTSDLCLTFSVMDVSKNANRKIIAVHDLYPFIKCQIPQISIYYYDNL